MADFRREIEWAAQGADTLDPDLVEAIVAVESSYNRWAWNPEPRYRWLWDVTFHKPFRTLTADEARAEFPPRDFRSLGVGIDPDAEWWGQQASWGLMQVMGAVARERGLRTPFLTSLLDPSIGLEFGCAHLAHLIRTQPDVERAIQAYNAGPGGVGTPVARIYSSKVLRTYDEIQKARRA